MGLRDDLQSQVKKIFADSWVVEETDDVPDPEDLRLTSNHAKHLKKATVLYADLDGSTTMVDQYRWSFCAEVYEAYLRCAAQIIRSEGGSITAYDGDRVMAIFTGKTKNTDAVRTALKINYAVEEIIRPALKKQYPDSSFTLKHVIGVDTSELRAARIGVRNDNDLVWVGRAANYAAKLTNLSDKPIWITADIYNGMLDSVKFAQTTPMWESWTWNSMNKMRIYCTTYRQPL